MSLILATGTNLGNKSLNLELAKEALSKKFSLIASSRPYHSAPVDYLDQPDFLNQVLEFETPLGPPESILQEIMAIESSLGRQRSIPKGPRLIDVDIIFIDFQVIQTEVLSVPHPSWKERPFVWEPLMELPFFESLKQHSFWSQEEGLPFKN